MPGETSKPEVDRIFLDLAGDLPRTIVEDGDGDVRRRGRRVDQLRAEVRELLTVPERAEDRLGRRVGSEDGGSRW